ncbi:F-box domain-containing protein [Favolaschia claudopus]|uniref:F-box domain-containing protein n=1 Tax=Favolaschia claudopus TaxID=2862362 RepID=A0AAW0AC46_9AGAR
MSFCDSICALRFASESLKKHGHLARLHPELLSGAFYTPSDSQTTEIQQEIRRIEDELSTVDSHFARLTAARDQLIIYRARLETSAESYRGVLSSLRRIPNELLVEIFELCIDPDSPLDPKRHASWIMSQVCSHWRAVAINSPSLWRHIHHSYDFHTHQSLLSTQLERAQRIPRLSIRLLPNHTDDALDLVLQASAQWEQASLDLANDGFVRFFNHTGTFTALKRLSLRSWDKLPATFTVDWSHSFTRLEELSLDLCYDTLPHQLPIPWAQLRVLCLSNGRSLDLLWLVSQLSAVTTISVSGGGNYGNEPPTSRTVSRSMTSLTLNDCAEVFIEEVLGYLVAPALQTMNFKSSRPAPRDRLITFLRQSRCNLKRLHVDAVITPGCLEPMLRWPCTQSITHLRLPNTSVNPRDIVALASHSQLRSLILARNAQNVRLRESLLESLPNLTELILLLRSEAAALWVGLRG